MTLPDLSGLKSRLRVEPVNTGRRIALFGPSGVITDDIERLYAISDECGRIMFQSGLEFPAYAWRGQVKEHKDDREHPVCLPGLGRYKKPEDQLLQLCRCIAFEDVLPSHPMVTLAEQTTFLGSPLFVDKEGLAQHYGLATDRLDLTSNFDVASFFATCRWDGKNGYVPMESVAEPGIIYRAWMALPMNHNGHDSSDDPFRIVGWQPLPRPEQQRAFAMCLKPDQDFGLLPYVEKHYFRHRAKVSHRIWKAFDKGGLLFPRDAAAELSQAAKALTAFTRDQVDRAWSRLEVWLGRSFEEDKRIAMEDSNLSVVHAEVLNWQGLGVEHDADRQRERMYTVLETAGRRFARYL